MPMHIVHLSNRHERFIGEVVASGRYDDASDVMHQALRLLEELDSNDAAKRALLLALIDEGEADYARGDYVEIADDQLEEWLDSLTKTAPFESAR